MQDRVARATGGVATDRERLIEEEADGAAREAWIERLAQVVVKRGLETPAVLFLEMHKPLCFFGSQGLLFAMPLLGAFFEPREVEQMARLLDSQENVERLIARIDELSAQEGTG